MFTIAFDKLPNVSYIFSWHFEMAYGFAVHFDAFIIPNNLRRNRLGKIRK